ncbi:hypothetical protein I4U23_002104 [Adineta vaga]|nr:hypothetical protein I4U23_002104 [Adineta vaga]
MYKKQALLIGNVKYAEGDLVPCAKDAKDTAASLQSIGFQVRVGLDLGNDQMKSTIQQFARSVRPGAVVIFYYSGHGAQFDGKNILLPIDFSDLNCTNAQNVIQQLHQNRPRAVIVILDCCRTRLNILDEAKRALFFDRRPRLRDGLTPMGGPPSTIIAYGCAAGESSIARSNLRNSVYTHHLRPRITTPDVDLETILKYVAIDVQRDSDNEQLPFIFSNCNEPIYLNSNSWSNSPAWPRAVHFNPVVMMSDNRLRRKHHATFNLRPEMTDFSHGFRDYSRIPTNRYPLRNHLWSGAMESPHRHW